MSSEVFPSDTCVLVCSGPSLNLVDPFELGVPVVVISTAIRVITNPHYWILADQLNEMHGEPGNIAYQNENIIKILPTGKISSKNKDSTRSFKEYNYASSDREFSNIDSHLFSGKLPFIKGPHKSVTFGIQWLHYVGVKNVIWVGNDLRAESPQKKYAYESNSIDLRKSYNYHVTIDQVHNTLENWYPKAKNKGFNWYSWNCGEIFESFVPKFDYENFKKQSNTIFNKPVNDSLHPIVPAVFNKVITKKIPKKERAEIREFQKNKKKTIKHIESSKEEEPILPKVKTTKYTKAIAPKIVKYTRYSKIKEGEVTSVNKRIRDSLR